MVRMLTAIALTFALLMPAAAHGAQVVLTWQDNSNDETGFVVQRRLREAPAETYLDIAQTGPDAESYTDETVEIGTLYCYRVKAFNTAGHSPPSNDACLLTTPTGAVIVYTP